MPQAERVIRIGRGPDNDLILTDRSVSSRHDELQGRERPQANSAGMASA